MGKKYYVPFVGERQKNENRVFRFFCKNISNHYAVESIGHILLNTKGTYLKYGSICDYIIDRPYEISHLLDARKGDNLALCSTQEEAKEIAEIYRLRIGEKNCECNGFFEVVYLCHGSKVRVTGGYFIIDGNCYKVESLI